MRRSRVLAGSSPSAVQTPGAPSPSPARGSDSGRCACPTRLARTKPTEERQTRTGPLLGGVQFSTTIHLTLGLSRRLHPRRIRRREGSGSHTLSLRFAVASSSSSRSNCAGESTGSTTRAKTARRGTCRWVGPAWRRIRLSPWRAAAPRSGWRTCWPSRKPSTGRCNGDYDADVNTITTQGTSGGGRICYAVVVLKYLTMAYRSRAMALLTRTMILTSLPSGRSCCRTRIPATSHGIASRPINRIWATTRWPTARTVAAVQPARGRRCCRVLPCAACAARA